MANTNAARTIKSFLRMSTQALIDVGINSARLDSELLLSHYLNLPREWIVAHDDAEIAEPQWVELCKMLYLRAQRVPLAYLTGVKSFYGRDFIVNEDVLIPRPESEQIIESLKQLVVRNPQIKSIADVGTGSGCLAITAKLEIPNLEVIALDISNRALAIAKQNERNLGLDGKIKFIQSDLLSNLTSVVDVIIANLPYVNRNWDNLSPELKFEPDLALYDDIDNATGLIKKLISETSSRLSTGGYLILEMDNRQIDEVSDFAIKNNFAIVDTKPFTLILKLG